MKKIQIDEHEAKWLRTHLTMEIQRLKRYAPHGLYEGEKEMLTRLKAFRRKIN